MRLSFDRGTLLLENVPSGVELPGTLWDPRVRAHRAPAHRHHELTSRLDLLGVRYADEVRTPGHLEGAWIVPELRPYQSTAVSAWRLAGARGVVVLPTGAGKTRVALAAMAGQRLRTLVMVPTRVLVDQWLASIAAFYSGPVGSYSDGKRELAGITVATFESALRHMPSMGHAFELLVIDEVHHFGQGMRDEALEMCAAAARLGLTATPGTSTRVGELVGPVVHQLSIDDLAGSALADFDTQVVHVDLEPRERASYERLIQAYQPAVRAFWAEHPLASWSHFVRAAGKSAAGRRALTAWRDARRLVAYPAQKQAALADLLARHRDARILIFTADVATAYAVSRRHLVMPLTADIGRGEREAALQAFRDGRLTTLVSARVLNEGLDVPDAEIGIILGGALGAREHVQRVGRLLRPRPGKRAIIYELVVRRTAEVSSATGRRSALATNELDPYLPSW